MFGLFDLLISLVLFTNAVAILNEERFLRPRGWGYGESFPGQSGFKDKIIPILHAMRVFRMPLILVNIITITYLLILY